MLRPLGEAEKSERLHGLLVEPGVARRVAEEAQARSRPRLHGERDILERGEARQDRGDLKAPHEAAAGARVHRQAGHLLAVEDDAPAVARERARELVDEARLAGAIRPDERVQLAPGNVERDRVGDAQRAEALGHAIERQQGLSHGGGP